MWLVGGTYLACSGWSWGRGGAKIEKVAITDQVLAILGQRLQRSWFVFQSWSLQKLWVRVLLPSMVWTLSNFTFSLSEFTLSLLPLTQASYISSVHRALQIPRKGIAMKWPRVWVGEWTVRLNFSELVKREEIWNQKFGEL